jgi:hypothetical protein
VLSKLPAYCKGAKDGAQRNRESAKYFFRKKLLSIALFPPAAEFCRALTKPALYSLFDDIKWKAVNQFTCKELEKHEPII